MRRSLKLAIVISIIVILSIGECGCQQGGEKKPKQSSSEQQEMPAEMKDMRKKMDEMITSLEKMAKTQMGMQEQESSGGQSDQPGQGGSSGKSSEQEDGQQSAAGGEAKQGSADSITGEWSNIEKGVQKIHEQWNSVEAKAMEQGLDTVTRDNFESSLDQLTAAVMDKKISDSIFALLSAYGYYPDIADAFKAKVPTDLYRVIYRVMLIKARSGVQEWNKADENVIGMMAEWESVKQSEEIKKEKELLTQTQNSLEDVRHAVDLQDFELVEIKSDIALKNLKGVEKMFIRSISS